MCKSILGVAPAQAFFGGGNADVKRLSAEIAHVISALALAAC